LVTNDGVPGAPQPTWDNPSKDETTVKKRIAEGLVGFLLEAETREDLRTSSHPPSPIRTTEAEGEVVNPAKGGFKEDEL